MGSPEVDYVLDAIQRNGVGYGVGGYGLLGYGVSQLEDIPLERIDQDNADNIDKADGVAALSGPVHEHSDKLTGMNFVMARSVSTSDSVLDSNYNIESERIVGVTLEGAHIGKKGAIDPQRGTANEKSVAWPTTTWDALKRVVRNAIYVDRITPTPNRANAAYKDLFIENQQDTSSDWTDFYRLSFDVRFTGFEELP